MNKYIKAAILSILIFPTLLYAQKVDSLNVKKNSDLPRHTAIDSVSNKKVADTISVAPMNNKDNEMVDVLYLKNGDKITGKLISLERGLMRFDAQGPGMITVKWYKIKTISCGNNLYRIETTRGDIIKGRIIGSSNSGEVTVLSIPRQDLKIEDIGRIFLIEDKWYKGFKGNLGAGVSYTKSSDVLRINAESNLYYTAARWRFVNIFSYISTSTADSDFSERIQFSLEEFYALRKRWFLYEQNAFSKNDELGIDAKISFGAGAGKNLVLTEIQKLQVYSGVLQNFEQDIENNKLKPNLEWPVTLQYVFFSFLNPNLTATTSISSFVGITENRLRCDATADLTWEFVNNFKLQLSFYYNYDNKIIEGKKSEYDYGPILSLLLDLK